MREEIIKFIEEELEITDKVITKDTKIVEDLGADSLDKVELLLALKEKYHLEFDEEDAKGIKTVGDLVEFLERHRKDS